VYFVASRPAFGCPNLFLTNLSNREGSHPDSNPLKQKSPLNNIDDFNSMDGLTRDSLKYIHVLAPAGARGGANCSRQFVEP
jgi:hypothetical protein